MNIEDVYSFGSDFCLDGCHNLKYISANLLTKVEGVVKMNGQSLITQFLSNMKLPTTSTLIIYENDMLSYCECEFSGKTCSCTFN